MIAGDADADDSRHVAYVGHLEPVHQLLLELVEQSLGAEEQNVVHVERQDTDASLVLVDVHARIRLERAKGGIDCGGTFDLVFKLQRIRMMLATAVKLDYEVHMLDVQTAFLKADVEEDVFITMALGYETNHKAGGPLVVKLSKSLYGLRQCPKSWIGTIKLELAVKIV